MHVILMLFFVFSPSFCQLAEINVVGAWEYIVYVYIWEIIDACILHGFAYINISFRHLSRATFPLFCCCCSCANASYAQCFGFSHSVAQIAMCSHFEGIKNALKHTHKTSQKHFLSAFLLLLYTCSIEVFSQFWRFLFAHAIHIFY